jgi:DNA-binding transcriptional MerR regulator
MMNKEQVLKAYTIQEVSKKIQIPPGTLRQWEKDLEGVLFIPRTKQGARYYTEYEISLLEKIKQMRDKNLSKEMIRELMSTYLQQSSETFETSLTPAPTPANELMVAENMLHTFDQFKQEFIQEIREEIREGIRKVVLDEVKKEISRGSLQTVKAISDSIYKQTEKTMDVIKESIAKTSEETSELFRTLSKRLTKNSKATSEEIRTLSNLISESSETTSEEFKTLFAEEFNYLTETMHQEREYYMDTIKKERELYKKEIMEREQVFRELVVSFRQTAATKQHKKWWEFWK